MGIPRIARLVVGKSKTWMSLIDFAYLHCDLWNLLTFYDVGEAFMAQVPGQEMVQYQEQSRGFPRRRRRIRRFIFCLQIYIAQIQVRVLILEILDFTFRFFFFVFSATSSLTCFGLSIPKTLKFYCVLPFRLQLKICYLFSSFWISISLVVLDACVFFCVWMCNWFRNSRKITALTALCFVLFIFLSFSGGDQEWRNKFTEKGACTIKKNKTGSVSYNQYSFGLPH